MRDALCLREMRFDCDAAVKSRSVHEKSLMTNRSVMQMHRERRNCGTRFPHVENVHDEHTRKYCYVNVAHFACSSSLFLRFGRCCSRTGGRHSFGFHQHAVNTAVTLEKTTKNTPCICSWSPVKSYLLSWQRTILECANR